MSPLAPVFDADLIERYDRAGPRYTSYPTAVEFGEDFAAADYRREAQALPAGTPLSIYVHVPFCDTVCYYCACNKVITRNRRHADRYLGALAREIDAQSTLLDGAARGVEQLHFGGGTPTYLSPDQLESIMAGLQRRFRLLDDDAGQYSIEIDPRSVGPDTVRNLRSLGFNRMSMGVQDFDPRVQRAVNRVQSPRQTWAVLDAARACGFRSVSVDLIYGLPHQSVASFDRTIDEVVAARPDRLSVFNYAHLPSLFKTQRQIDEAALPSPATKLAILRHTVSRLLDAGYAFIGMDHFALPDDELCEAARAGTLQRNFQGYSTHSGHDLVGLGPSAIGQVGSCYAQNDRDFAGYCERVAGDGLAVFRGIEIDAEDRLRREIIGALICRFEVDVAAIEARYGLCFEEHFAAELDGLREMAGDGLVTLAAKRIAVLPRGRLLVRNVCMLFDRHRRAAPPGQRFSRVI